MSWKLRNLIDQTTDKNNCCKDPLPNLTEKQSLVCGVCSEIFLQKDQFKQHLLDHIEDSPFICYICQEVFTVESHLIQHFNSHRENPIKSSDSSKVSIKTSSNLLSHSGKNYFLCGVCNDMITEKELFKQHLLDHIEKPPFICFLCEQTFLFEKDLRKHLDSHNKESNFSSRMTCGESINSKRNLLSSNEEKPYICGVCNGLFSEKNVFKEHLLNHAKETYTFTKQEIYPQQSHLNDLVDTDIKSFASTNDKKYHSQQSNLNSHMANAEQHPFICDECKKVFSSKSSLKRHFRLHTNKKPFVCTTNKKSHSQNSHKINGEKHPSIYDESKKVLSSKSNLKRHFHLCTDKKIFVSSTTNKKSHLRQRNLNSPKIINARKHPFICDKCQKVFNSKLKLELHFKIHAGKKNYVCTKCKKAFTQKANLNVHLRLHTGNKPFACSQCKKAFAQKENLICHFRSHTGEKPYKCTTCQKAFDRSGNLYLHLRIHTGIKPFTCSTCQMSFYQKSHLISHVQSIHKNTTTLKIKKEE